MFLLTNAVHGANLRSVIVILVLVIGLLAVYAPRLWTSAPAPVADGAAQYIYISDLDFWQRTPRETTVTATTRFDLNSDLNNVPLVVGDWRGETVPETNQEVMILLDPEQYVQRLYQDSQGRYIWLSMIGGRSSQPFHAPDICYDADGWQYDFGSHAVTLNGGGQLYGYWLDAHKQMPGESEPAEHIVSYFYLFPNQERQLADGIVLFKLTSSRYDTVEDTLDLHAGFIRNFFVSAD